MDYVIEEEEDYEDLPFAGIGARDVVYVIGDLELDHRLPSVTVVAQVATVTAPSSLDATYSTEDGTVVLVWDGATQAHIAADTALSSIHLQGWPAGRTPWFPPGQVREGTGFTIEDSADDETSSPEHYTWIGDAIVRHGGPQDTDLLESWDILDAAFPDNPHLWNAGKYLLRFGRKGSADRRIVDLRKARAYLDRAIVRLERADG